MRSFRDPLVGLLLVSLLTALGFSGAANADDTAEEFVYSDGAKLTEVSTALENLNYTLTAADTDDAVLEFRSSSGVDLAQLAHDATAETPVSKDAKQAAQNSLVSSDIDYGWEASPATGISIYWSQVPRVSEYEVYRDGKLVSVTSDAYFVDEATVPGETYHYKILMERPRLNPVEKTSSPNSVPGFEGATISLTAIVPISGNDTAAVLEHLESEVMPLAASSATQFMYTTFINTATAPGFPCVAIPTNTYFAGDNRTYNANATSFQSRKTVTVHWPSQNISASNAVGVTKNYNNNGTLRGTKTASTSKMYLTIISKNSTTARFVIDDAIANPFCTHLTQAIRYQADITVTKAGTYALTGYRRKAPHHEAYIRADSGAWKTVLRLPNEGFEYLSPTFPTQSLNYSGTY